MRGGEEEQNEGKRVLVHSQKFEGRRWGLIEFKSLKFESDLCNVIGGCVASLYFA